MEPIPIQKQVRNISHWHKNNSEQVERKTVWKISQRLKISWRQKMILAQIIQ
jgi:hypothetical protein